MCSVVLQANPFVEGNPTARADYGTTKIVTQDLGTLEANQETSFNLKENQHDAPSGRELDGVFVCWGVGESLPPDQ
jgi:hypothetical protein